MKLKILNFFLSLTENYKSWNYAYGKLNSKYLQFYQITNLAYSKMIDKLT